MWTCPKCGHQFVIANIWHSCGNYELDDHFQGKDPRIREVFDAWRGLAEACGQVTVYAQKSRIVFQVRVRFGGAVIRKRYVDAALWLMRGVEHPRLARTESFGSLGYGHHFRLETCEDLDEDLAALMREAYAIGCQEHLRGRR
jgi:hypothetical protein